MKRVEHSLVDALTVDFLNQAFAEADLSNKAIERLTNGAVGYNRVRDIRLQERGPMRLTEFVELCEAIGDDPADSLRAILAGRAAVPRGQSDGDAA